MRVAVIGSRGLWVDDLGKYLPSETTEIVSGGATVDMNGDGFLPKVRVGDKVTKGQCLLTFDSQKIKAAGHPTTTAFIVTNSDEVTAVRMETSKTYQKAQKIGTVTA